LEGRGYPHPSTGRRSSADIVRHAVDPTACDCLGGGWQEPVFGQQLFSRIMDYAHGFNRQHETAVQATGYGHLRARAFARWPFPGFRRRSIELQRVDYCILSSAVNGKDTASPGIYPARKFPQTFL